MTVRNTHTAHAYTACHTARPILPCKIDNHVHAPRNTVYTAAVVIKPHNCTNSLQMRDGDRDTQSQTQQVLVHQIICQHRCVDTQCLTHLAWPARLFGGVFSLDREYEYDATIMHAHEWASRTCCHVTFTVPPYTQWMVWWWSPCRTGPRRPSLSAYSTSVNHFLCSMSCKLGQCEACWGKDSGKES